MYVFYNFCPCFVLMEMSCQCVLHRTISTFFLQKRTETISILHPSFLFNLEMGWRAGQQSPRTCHRLRLRKQSKCDEKQWRSYRRDNVLCPRSYDFKDIKTGDNRSCPNMVWWTARTELPTGEQITRGIERFLNRLLLCIWGSSLWPLRII